MKKIIIQGAGFADNFGDVLFYDIFLKEAKRNNIEVNLLSINPNVKKHLEINNIDKKSKIKSFLESEGIVFIGGGYMGEQPYPNKVDLYKWGMRTIKNILYVGVLGVIFRKKIVVIGVGAGPITNPLTKFTIRLICNFSYKTLVRDQESYEFMKSINVNINKLEKTTDSVLALNDYYTCKKENSNEKIIAIHLSESFNRCSKTNILIKDLVRFLDEKPEYRLLAITDHNGGGQERSVNDLKELFGNKIDVCRYSNPEQLINTINNSSIVITNKLHVGIVAATLGKSVYSFPNHHKVKRFFQQINESKRCILFNDVTEGQFYSLIKEFEANPIRIEDELIELARYNLATFKEFVSL